MDIYMCYILCWNEWETNPLSKQLFANWLISPLFAAEQGSGPRRRAFCHQRPSEHVLLPEHSWPEPVPHLTFRSQHLQWHVDSSVSYTGSQPVRGGPVRLSLPGWASWRPLTASGQPRALLQRPHLLQREHGQPWDRWAKWLSSS